MSISQRAVMLRGWEGNRRAGYSSAFLRSLSRSGCTTESVTYAAVAPDLGLRLPSRPQSTSCHYSLTCLFSIPPRVGGWVGLSGWLHTKMVGLYSSLTTNRVRRRLANFIEALVAISLDQQILAYRVSNGTMFYDIYWLKSGLRGSARQSSMVFSLSWS